MKHIVIFALALLWGVGTSFARQNPAAPENKTGATASTDRADLPRVRRFEVGVRSGVNFADYSFASVRIANARFAPASVRTGYDVGLVLRLNLSRHLHIQSELNYAFVNYGVRAYDPYAHTVMLRTERLEIPVQLGFQFGILRLFAGAQFRVADSERSSAPQLLHIGFNDSDIGIMGGAGLRIRKFFLEFRVSGYPRSSVWHDFRSNGIVQRVKSSQDIVYGGSLGFFF